MLPVRASVIVLLVVCGWLALMPPFFTHGACTAEFDAASEALQRARPALGTLTQAQDYLRAQAMPFRMVTAEQCDSSPAWEVEVCHGGPVLLVALPVKNRVCRYYRDSSIRVQLGFNKTLELVRMQSDMNPYHMLKLPILGLEVDWAK
ncbi:MAG TPA: hypothetical protein VGP32_00880 [Steroidobacteraceae bacterium]|nr:hypothetical protein [Steroidobacteraceae bacterium]